MTIPSLQELCLRSSVNQMGKLPEEDIRIEIIAQICEEVVLRTNPALTFQARRDYIKEYESLDRQLTAALREHPQLKNMSLGAIHSHLLFRKLQSQEFWAMQRAKVDSEMIQHLMSLRDPFAFFAAWIRVPIPVPIPGVSSKEICLIRLVTLGYWSGIRSLVDLGANINIEFHPPSEDPSRTLLHYSIRRWKFGQMTKALIEAGADMNRLDHSGLSPLELIAQKAQIVARPGFDMEAALQFFIHHGANASLYGQSALEKIKANREVCSERYARIKETYRIKAIRFLERQIV